MTLFIPTFLLFILSITGYTLNTESSPNKRVITTLHTLTLWTTILCHGCLLYQWLHVPHGLNLNLLTTSSLIAWLITIISFFPELHPAKNKTVLHVLTLVISLITICLVQWLPVSSHIITTKTPQLTHISLSLIAYSALSLAGLQAILLSIQNHQLKHKKTTFISFLPAIDTMEKVLIKLLIIGTILLTVSIITGFLFTQNILEQKLSHKTFFSLLAWAIFTILIWGNHRYGWRSQTAIRWTICGLACLILGYIGSKFVLEILLT